MWDDAADDDLHVAWSRTAVDRLAVGSFSGAGYANYAPVDETNERVRAAFGTERFSRLATIKARYDPENRFRFNLNIGPAVIRPPQA
jgi:FAD/FMN-containing dehydrogenase